MIVVSASAPSLLSIRHVIVMRGGGFSGDCLVICLDFGTGRLASYIRDSLEDFIVV